MFEKVAQVFETNHRVQDQDSIQKAVALITNHLLITDSGQEMT